MKDTAPKDHTEAIEQALWLQDLAEQVLRIDPVLRRRLPGQGSYAEHLLWCPTYFTPSIKHALAAGYRAAAAALLGDTRGLILDMSTVRPADFDWADFGNALSRALHDTGVHVSSYASEAAVTNMAPAYPLTFWPRAQCIVPKRGRLNRCHQHAAIAAAYAHPNVCAIIAFSEAPTELVEQHDVPVLSFAGISTR